MMRSSVTVVAAAIVIGFVSVLVYHVSASDALGLGQLPMPAAQVGVASRETSPVKVAFIVQQCDIAGSEAIHVAAQSEVLDVPPEGATSKVSFAPPVEEIVPEDEPVARQRGFVTLSPSILYIP